MPRKTSSTRVRPKPASNKPNPGDEVAGGKGVPSGPGATHSGKRDLVVITGLSGSGKGSVLRALEDLGFYSVDNLPVELIPKFAELTHDNPSIQAAAQVVDVREGEGLKRFPKVFSSIRKSVNARLIFLEADNEAIVRRFSETRRPHPVGTNKSITKSILSERAQLAPIRAMAISPSTPRN